MSLLSREIRLTLERGWGWMTAVVVFAVVVSLVALSVGGTPARLRNIGPGVAWAGVLLGLMVACPPLFSRDVENGAIDQLWLRGHSYAQITGAKFAAVLLMVVLPLVIGAAIVSQLLFLNARTVVALVASLVVGAPALAAYGTFLGALTSRRGAAGLVGVLVMLPLLAPTLIFGVGAVEAPPDTLWQSGGLKALAGLSLIGTVVGWAGAVAALRTHQG